MICQVRAVSRSDGIKGIWTVANRMVGILCVDSTVTISIQPQFRYSFGDFGNLSWFR